MSALIPFLALDQTSDQVQTWVIEQLTGAGFRVAQTFDLQVARLTHSDCPCPHHGTNDCNCQMIVLLVDGNQGEPVTLVIHGQDHNTWLSLVSPLGQRANPHLESAIRRALIPRLPNALQPIEVVYETHATV